MRPENLHDLLVGAVPPLTTPPDRMAQVRRRVVRARGLRVSASVLGVLAIVGGAALGVHALAPVGRSGPNAVGQVPGATSVAPGASVAPSASVEPSTGPSSRFRSIPPSGLGVGQCPQSLDLMSVDGAHRPDLTFQGPPATVTVCRYRHAAFDMSVGNADLLKGPKQGTSAAFAGPIQNVLNDTQPATGGCLYPSPYQNLSVDVVYAVDAHGNKLDFYLMRIVCTGGGDWAPSDLTGAIDGLMGTPY